LTFVAHQCIVPGDMAEKASLDSLLGHVPLARVHEDDVIDAYDDADHEVTATYTARQRAFVREYIKDENGAQAALRAGYSVRHSKNIACRLMKYDHIQDAIAQAKEQRREYLEITPDKILAELAVLANARVDHYVVNDDGYLAPAPGAPEGVMAAVRKVTRKVRWLAGKADEMPEKIVEVTFELWDKPGQLKLLGKHVGILADRVEHTGKNGGAIETVTRIENVIIDPKATP